MFSHGYALLVGVGQTIHQPWSLPVTVRDAGALRRVLIDPERCAYPADTDHVRLLHDAGATRQALRDGLAWLAECARADGNATVVVFFSGHGWVALDGAYYLIPHDTDPADVIGTALAGQEFTALLRAISARRLLVILDCCHAGGMATSKDGTPLPSLPEGLVELAPPKGLIDQLSQGAGRAVFSSSLGSQPSWVRPDGLLSLYTFHLIEAFEGKASRPDDSHVRISGLMAHLGVEVPRNALRMGREQTPFFDTAAEDFAVALLRGGKAADAPSAQLPGVTLQALDDARTQLQALLLQQITLRPLVPASIYADIRKTREEIQRLKQQLRAAGYTVDDSYDDTAPV